MDLEAIFNVRNFFPPIENSFWMRIKRIWTENRVYNSSYYYSVVSFNIKVRWFTKFGGIRTCSHCSLRLIIYLHHLLTCIWISGWRENTTPLIVTGNKVNFRPNMAPPFLEYWKFVNITFSKVWFCFESKKGYQPMVVFLSNTVFGIHVVSLKPFLRTWTLKLLKINKWKKMH